VAEHGDVKYIILPTASGLNTRLRRSLRQKPERAGLCCSKPVELSAKPPAQLARFRGDGLRCSQRIALMPLASEFDYAVLDINLGRGSGSGILKRSRTLLVTDSVLSVPEDPPAIVQLEPYPLFRKACVRDRRGQPGKPPQGMAAHLAVCLYLRPSALEMIEQRFAMPSKRRIAQGKRISVCFRSDGKITGSSHLMPRGVDVCLWHHSADVHS